MTVMPVTQATNIREMRVEDVDQVHQLDRLSFSLPWPLSAYLYEINQNESSLAQVVELVTESGEKQIIAMIVIWIILDEAHIATIAVHPDYRRQGIARQLLVESLRSCISRGVKTATLEVRESNLAAQRLYGEFKFFEVGRRKNYYRDNKEDAILMTANHLSEEYLQSMEQDFRLS